MDGYLERSAPSPMLTKVSSKSAGIRKEWSPISLNKREEKGNIEMIAL